MLRSWKKNLIWEKVTKSSVVSDFLLSMNINVPNEDNLRFISPLFCIQVPSFHSHWFVVKEQICHGKKWLPRLFILNLSRKTPLFRWSEDISFSSFYSKDFSWASVKQKLSRCVGVLIKCGKPIFLFCCERGTKATRHFVRRATNKYTASKAKWFF